MTWGPNLFVLRESYRRTGVLPPALQSRPDLTRDVAFYLEAFFFLSSFRSYGMGGPLPIPLSEIATYARLIGYNAEDTLFLAEVINACDSVYLTKVANDTKAAQAAKKPASGARTVSSSGIRRR